MPTSGRSGSGMLYIFSSYLYGEGGGVVWGAVNGGVGGWWECMEIAKVLSDSFINAKCTRQVHTIASDETEMNGQAERQEGLLTLQ